MKKIFIIMLIILLSNTFFSLAVAQTPLEARPLTGQTTSGTNSSSSILQIKSASAIFQNIKNIIKEKAQKMTGLKRGGAVEKIKAWFSQHKEAIKIGWQEEKQEFKGGFKQILKQILSDVWQKIRNLVVR